MNIIVFGGSGFIGSRTAQILKEQGHQVCTPNRRAFDFLHPDETAARRLLEGQDVLINCIGIMSRHAEILETVHHHTPRQLAAWAKAAGVTRWVPTHLNPSTLSAAKDVEMMPSPKAASRLR